MADKKIIFDVGFNIEKESLNSLKTQLKELQNLTKNDLFNDSDSSAEALNRQLIEIRQSAEAVESALGKAYNSKLDTLNVQTFRNEISKSGYSISDLQNNFSKAGEAGEAAFVSVANQLTNVNSYAKQSNKLMDSLAQTITNTIRWNVVSTAFNSVTQSISNAWSYVQKLDTSLNNIQIVTGKSSEQMQVFAEQANKTAKSLGAYTTSYTDAALTFYQQGLGEEEANARAELATKVSNVTGLSGDDAAEYVTSVLNGYKVGSADAENAMDKLAAVAKTTASDLAELSEGMAQVASSANSMGVSEDQLAAMLSTTISVTRQDASSVGNAYKTIFARISDIAAGTSDAEVSLGTYTGEMAKLGFSVLDSTGSLRDLGDVIEEIGGKWSSLSKEQQVSLAQTMAGTRQYNNLISLFDNWSDYEDALSTSMNANGEIAQEQETYMESIQAHLKTLSTSWDDFYDSMLNSGTINSVIDGLSSVGSALAKITDSLGGGNRILANVGAMATQIISKQIGSSVAALVTNFKYAKAQAEEFKQALSYLDSVDLSKFEDPDSVFWANSKKQILQSASMISPEKSEKIAVNFDSFAADKVSLAKNQKNREAELNKLPTGFKYTGLENKELDYQNYQDLISKKSASLETGLKNLFSDTLEDDFSNFLEGDSDQIDLNNIKESLENIKNVKKEISDSNLFSEKDLSEVGHLEEELNNILNSYKNIEENSFSKGDLVSDDSILGLLNNENYSEAGDSLIALQEKLNNAIADDSNITSESLEEILALKEKVLNTGLISDEDFSEIDKTIKKFEDLVDEKEALSNTADNAKGIVKQGKDKYLSDEDAEIGTKISDIINSSDTRNYDEIYDNLLNLDGLDTQLKGQIESITQQIQADLDSLNVQALTSSLTQAAGATAQFALSASQLRSGITSAIEGTSSFSDVLVNLLFTIPSIATSFSTIKKSLNSFSAALSQMGDSQTKAKEATIKAVTETLKSAEAKDKDTQAANRQAQANEQAADGAKEHQEEEKQDTKQTKKNTVAKKENKNASNEESSATSQSTVKTEANSAAVEENTVETEENTLAKEENAAAGSKTTGVLSTLVSSFSSFGSIASWVIGGITLAYSVFSGIAEAQKKKIEEAKEELDTLQEKAEELSSDENTYKSNNASLEAMKEDYEELSKIANANNGDSNVDALTDDQRERYNEIKEEIASLNEDVIAGYNEEGEVILKNNEALEDTISLLKEELELKKQEILESDEWKNGAENRSTETQGYSDEIENLKVDINDAIGLNNTEYDDLYRDSLDRALKNEGAYNEETGLYDTKAIEELLKEGSLEDPLLGKKISFTNLSDEDLEQIVSYYEQINTDQEKINELAKGWSTSLMEYMVYEGDAYDALANTKVTTVEGETESLGTTTASSISSSYIKQLSEAHPEMSEDEAKAAAESGLENIAKVMSAAEEANDFSFYDLQGLVEEGNQTSEYNFSRKVGSYIENLKEQGLFDGLDDEEIQREIISILDSMGITAETDDEGNLTGTYTTESTKASDSAKAKLQTSFGNDPLFANYDVNGQNWEAFLNELSEKTGETKANVVASFNDMSSGIKNAFSDMSDEEALNSFANFFGGDETHFDTLAEDKIAILEEFSSDMSEAVTGLSSATTTEELFSYWEDYEELLNKLPEETRETVEATEEAESVVSSYQTKLEELAANYDNAATELENYKSVLERYNNLKDEGSATEQDEAILEAAQDKLEAATLAGELAAKNGLDAEDIENFAEEYSNLADFENTSKKELVKLASAQLRYNQAVEDASDNINDWKTAVQKAQSGGLLDADVLSELKEEYANLLDLDTDDISTSFASSAENLELLQQALQGSTDAFKQLQEAAGEAYLSDIGLSPESVDNITSQLDNLITTFNNDHGDFEVGVALDQDDYSDFIDGLQKIVDASGMTAEQAQEYFKDMGFDVEFNTASATAEDSEQYYDWTPTPTDGITIGQTLGTGDLPIADYNAVLLNGVKWNSSLSNDSKKKNTKTVTGTAIKTVTPNGNANGGNIKQSYSNTTYSPKSTSSGSGSGSGSGSSNKKTTKKGKENKKDIYHDVDQSLRRIKKSLSAVQEQQETVFGEDLIKNLKEEVDLLDQQNSKLKERVNISKQHLSELGADLSSYGANFDSEGYITNYSEVYDNIQAEYQRGVDWWNSLSADEQATDEAKERWEAIEDTYDKAMDKLDDYDDTLEEIEDDEEEILENAYKIITKKAEAFQVKVEFTADLGELEREWQEFTDTVFNDLQDDDLVGQGKSAFSNIKSYFDSGEMQQLLSATKTGLSEYQKVMNGEYSSIYSTYDENGNIVSNKSLARENLQSNLESLMENYEEIVEKKKEVDQYYLDSIDALQDAYSEQIELSEFYADQIDHDLKLTELLYGETAYNKMSTYYDKLVENNKTQISQLRTQAEHWKTLMDEARASGDDDAYEKYKENWMSAINDLNSSVETCVDNIISKYSNTINEIIQKLNNSLTNSLGLDYVNEELDLLNTNAENYLDEINAAYAKQELQNKWQDAINDTDSIPAQKKLNELMQEQMKMLEEKGELTQYDVDRAEKEYEIALKQIALQEAQQNKSQMRLKRDANGNYSYQFVSDEDSIREAEQELAEAQNSLYNFDKDAYQENLNNMYSVWEEFQSKITDVMTDTSLTDEQRAEQIALLYEQYGENINYLVEQNANIRTNLEDSAFTELASMYDTNVEYFKNMTEEEQDLIMNNLIPQWDSGVQQMIDKISGEGGFEQVVSETFDNLDQACQDYRQELEEVGNTSDEISDIVSSTSNTLTSEIQDTTTAMEQQRQAMQDLKTEVDNYTQSLIDAIQANQDLLAAYQALMAEKNKYNKTTTDNTTTTTPTTTDGNGGSGDGGNGGSGDGDNSGSGGGGSKKKLTDARKKGIATAIWVIGDSAGWGDNPERAEKFNDKFGNKGSQIQDYIDENYSHLYSDWLNEGSYDLTKYYYDKFKKGGLADYTGMAWLDGTPTEPEMVLNADDTQNILSALDILDSIASSLQSNTLATLSSRIGNLGNLIIPSTNTEESEYEQNVYITANFEGKTEADQIQQALNNLVNIASQRAYRTNK